MAWWKDNPLLFNDFKRELESFPFLAISMENEKIILSGNWPVYGEKKLITVYKIKIIIPDDFPNSTPKVYEADHAIEKIADRHFNPNDGTACLFIVTEQEDHWPLGSNISLFLNKPVKEFFFSQAYYDLTNEWPFGSWSHGDKGLIEYCLDYLELKSKHQLIKHFQYLELKKPRKIKCPCGNGQPFKFCHFNKFKSLISKCTFPYWKRFQKNLMNGKIH
ncbi:Uncharacterised protein [Legionella pneumophila]|uniref:SEC-C domain-containing protein n=2 Tax=Legionella pneumophila TaxID=446 RepID=A0AAN5KSH3_LEGPN|nr:Uncharacterised protein [Legionella pneumophila]CZI37823.1 Uncharacterised protein [Legionella pneumophila]HAT1597050.1 hypothetical protein [Legionella pneumophila]HAT1971314.1 hypothetical protein [Legionella pneumophila]HDO7807052.1 hypothetical protein [Legionella pneumophila]